MKKKLTKIVWFGAEKDEQGNPLLPKLSESVEQHLDGLNEGELYLHNDDERPALFIRTNKDRIVAIGGGDLDYLSNYFLRKDKDDTAKGKITFEKGWQTLDFIGGLSGKGANLDESGKAELESLFVRSFLEVPEFRYNRVIVRMGDEINSVAAGIIESVTPNKDADENLLDSGTLTLKLEDGEFGSLEVDDIVFQIYSDMENKGNNATVTSDDGIGNRFIKGFATVMFKVTGVSGSRNEIISYSLRPSWNKMLHPYKFGTFSQRGNFTNTERQTIVYHGIYPKPYTRYMFGVNDWEFTPQMIGMQLGYLGNLTVDGQTFDGYSAYLNNVYFTGMIRQLYIPSWIEGESSAQNGTLVYMGGNHYVSKGDTDEAPWYELLDENGEPLMTEEDGEVKDIYTENNDDYDRLAQKGDDGIGINSTVVYYMLTSESKKPSSDSMEWGTYFVQPTDLKPYLWKKTVVTYSNLTKQTTIECISVRGKDGTSVNIKGSFDTERELIESYPNGPVNDSDAYIVVCDLFIWTGAQWKNVGSIKGEAGDTAWVHIKYAYESASGTEVNVGGSVVVLSFTTNDGEDVGDWMGIYSDHTSADSMDISAYKWKNIKGKKGDTGESGIFVYDCGLYSSGREYYYQTIDGEVRRDKIIYEIGGGYYNFVVRKRQADGSEGIKTAPTSANGDANWEVMSQFQSVIADTLFGSNANIGGFMASAERLRTQSEVNGEPKFEINGSKGSMVMRQEGGTVWEVSNNGVQSVGNSNGERVVIDPNDKSVSVFDSDGVQRTNLDGKEYEKNQLVAANGGTFILNSNATNTSGKTLTNSTTSGSTASYNLTEGLTFNYAGVAEVTINDFYVSLYHNTRNTSNTTPVVIPNGRVFIYLCTYASYGGVLTGKKLIAYRTVSYAIVDGSITTTDAISGTYSVALSSGYHRVEVEMEVNNGSSIGSTSVTAYWRLTGAKIVVESYMSRLFANGMMLSKSSSEYFMSMVENERMVVEAVTGTSGVKLNNGEIKLRYKDSAWFDMPISLLFAKVTVTGFSSGKSIFSSSYKTFDGSNITITEVSGKEGLFNVSIPSAWALSTSDIHVQATGFGSYRGNTSNGVCWASVLSISATQIQVVTSYNTNNEFDSCGFFLELKKI